MFTYAIINIYDPYSVTYEHPSILRTRKLETKMNMKSVYCTSKHKNIARVRATG